jgi:hypothetical protein
VDIHPELKTGKTMVSRTAKKQAKKATKRPIRQTSAKARTQKGSLRAQSWVYAVINPLIDVLESEIAALEKGNLSWHAHIRRLEFIRPPWLYLMPNGQAILEDFERTFPEDAQPLHAHERLVVELTHRAAAAHDDLVKLPAFVAKVRQLMKDYGKDSAPSLQGWSEEEALQQAAEWLINRGHGLERTHPFWKQAIPVLKEFCEGEAFSRLARTVDECRTDGRRLIDHLRDVRFRLCDEYDIPAAPVEGVVPAEQF